jgi:DNA-binding GntR family transcriptional regulator
MSTASLRLTPQKGASRALFDDVLAGLYEGRYEPGQRLVEAQLTSAYGMSRGPVREALNALAAIGVVELTPQRGAQITFLGIQQAIDILIVTQSLIGTAARLAAMNIDKGDGRERMQAALNALAAFDSNDNSPAFAIARESFYATLKQVSGNSELRRILPGVQVHIIRVQYRAILRDIDGSRFSDYGRIAEAVIAGNPAAAEAAAKTHIGRAIKALGARLA